MERILKTGPFNVLYARALEPVPEAGWFDPAWWSRNDRIAGRFGGRGQALAVDGPFGPGVLRQYLRGGLARRLARDRYLYTGSGRVRSVVEWRVLDRLHRAGLPVPEPVAAAWRQRGPLYQAWLITRRIDHACSLAERLAAGGLEDRDWQRLDVVLEAFFQAGVIHPDLNAGNILVDRQDHFYLLDFDRARIASKPVAGGAMRRRLARSLDKLGLPYPAGLLSAS